ncbi:MAG: hypothetical protein AAGA60_14870 [Cyanobacteria bacterium P01_E01_bin.42]
MGIKVKKINTGIQWTLREALKNQEKQLAHYSRNLSPEQEQDLRSQIADRTNIEGCDLDAKMDIVEVNNRVPRAGAIERCAYNIRGISLPR